MNKHTKASTSVQTPLEFFNDFTSSCRKSSKRVWLQSMNFDSGKLMNEIVDTLCKASERGVDVRLNIDWVANKFAYGELPLIPFLDFGFLRRSEEAKVQRNTLYEILKNAGVNIITTNKPNWIQHILPVIGRNHTKIYIIDDEAVWIGGVNLMDYSFHNEDVMVKIKDEVLIKALAEQFLKVNEKRATRNYVSKCMPGYTLLVDSGVSGESVIYDKAIQITKSAKRSVIFISQMVPDYKLLSCFLDMSAQGVNILIITSEKADAQFSKYPFKYFYEKFCERIKNNTKITLLHRQKKVHAKLLIIDDKQALFGSHNLVWSGVVLGTGEVGIHSTDKRLLQQLTEHVKNNYAS